MSLRARLVLGAALVALVLGVAGLAIVRITRDNLVDQVDGQLRAADERVGGGFRAGPPDGGREPGDEDEPGAAPALSSLYVGALTSAGDLQALRLPNLREGEPPVPRVSRSQVDELRAGRTITVAST